MSQTIHLNPSQVPATLKGNYSGRHFKARPCESVTIPAGAGLWSAGSRETYRIVRMSDGATLPGSDNMSAPWDDRRDRVVTLEPGICVIERCVYSGKDGGLTIYALPSDLAPLLPAPTAELSAMELAVLDYTRSRKSSYMGRDRCDMLREDVASDLRWGAKARFPTVPTRADWDAAKATLIERGYLNKAGAITTAGRNACGSNY